MFASYPCRAVSIAEATTYPAPAIIFTEANGQGVETFADGGRYEGMFKDDKRHGQGTLFLSNGNRYQGAWEFGRPEGLGEAWLGGEYYGGRWVSGCFRDARLSSLNIPS